MTAKEKRHIAILGSTGSIGVQALEVIDAHRDRLELEVLAANNNAELLIEQAIKFNPNAVAIGNESKYRQVFEALDPKDIKVYAGMDAIDQIVTMDSIDMVLAAIVGYAGLRSTLSAIEAGKAIALANKETLVVAGDLVTALAREKGVNIYPVDSEHSAIFQCLAGEFENKIEKIYLTASGGPFRGMTKDALAGISKEEALRHPNWEMGAKVTIDSATLMNKGLEAIEAKWLFSVRPDQIEVVVHPQSIVHSAVQFEDGSVKAQMGLPDMKLPIQYALGFPERLKTDYPRFSFMDYPSLTFEPPDTETFRNLALAFHALGRGGNIPCVLNAANEVAVAAFLLNRIGFNQMPELIEACVGQMALIKNPVYGELVATDEEARSLAEKLIRKMEH